MKKLITSSVLPLISLGLYAAPAVADIENSPVIVKNTNTAVVENVVVVSSNTGGNTANGGNAGNGGKGGSVWGSDHDNVGGNGGNAGDAGMGGMVTTGSAHSFATVENYLNSNETEVGNCGCEAGDLEDSKTVVVNENTGVSVNVVATGAETGANTTNGGNAGNGGKGGSVANSDHDNMGGMGGNSGMGGAGGTISSGMSASIAAVINVLNTNITRIHR